MRYAGQVVVIVGAGGAIGRASARAFAREGARVACLDLDLAAAQEAAALVEAERQVAFAAPCDVAIREQVERAVLAARQALGDPDVLFHVAGISGRRFGDGPVHVCTAEGWERVLAVNLTGVYHTNQAVLPAMMARRRGVILNLSSVLGLVGGGEDFATHAYAAAKGGIIALTRAMATYYARYGIRCNVICPGLIRTPMSQRAQSDPDILRSMAERQPLIGDLGEPEDVAGAALYLASDDARMVTGAVLTVDGGWTAQ